MVGRPRQSESETRWSGVAAKEKSGACVPAGSGVDCCSVVLATGRFYAVLPMG